MKVNFQERAYEIVKIADMFVFLYVHVFFLSFVLNNYVFSTMSASKCLERGVVVKKTFV